MKMSPRRVLSLMLALAMASGVARAQTAVRVGRERLVGHPAVKARLWSEKGILDATLVGRTQTHLALAPDAEGRTERIEIATLRAALFDISYDRFAVGQARFENKWSQAVKLQQSAYRATYPYLDIPNNNAVEGVFDLANDMWRAARYTERRIAADSDRELMTRQSEAALDLFQKCAAAEWSAVGLLAQMKAYRCQIALGRGRQAWLRMSSSEEPIVGDAAYGHYWIAQAELHLATNGFQQAMDAAVRSLAFETKDIECFPDALAVTARCYEELGEPYRARDVHFEIAKLFPGTDWMENAAARLAAIRAAGLVDVDETASVESVFFATDEDMNKLVDEFLEPRENR